MSDDICHLLSFHMTSALSSDSRSRPDPGLSFCVCQLSDVTHALHSLTHTDTTPVLLLQNQNQTSTQFSRVSASNIPASDVWFDTVTESTFSHDEHHPEKFQINEETFALTHWDDKWRCVLLFMEWTAKGPSWLSYCETEGEGV